MFTQYPIDDKSQVVNHQDKVGIKYYASGNLFVAKQVCKTTPFNTYCNRSGIHEFSAGSALRMRRYLRECRSDYRYMVTLTYPCGFESDGKISKNHLRRFIQEVQREFARGSSNITREIDSKPQRLSVFWFLEFQERGAPHYHLLCTHRLGKEWVSKRWYDIVNSEDIRHLHAGTRCEKLTCGRAGTVKYAIKYANKQEQKVVPIGYENVGRFWGVYGDRWCVSADTFVSRLDASLERNMTVVSQLKRLIKRMIDTNKLEIIKRDYGVLVGIVNNPKDMMMIRYRIHNVNLQVNQAFSYFEDAEVDQDENYSADKML
jgi:hypothetical protein